MKQNKVKLYAKALAQVLEKPARQNAKAFVGEKQDKIVNNFLALVKKNNLEKKVKEIIAMAEDIILAKQGKNKITFQTARKMNASQKKLLQNVAREGDVVKEKINPELIAGIKIIINENKQFDASMARKLSRIFAGSRQAGQN